MSKCRRFTPTARLTAARGNETQLLHVDKKWASQAECWQTDRLKIGLLSDRIMYSCLQQSAIWIDVIVLKNQKVRPHVDTICGPPSKLLYQLLLAWVSSLSKFERYTFFRFRVNGKHIGQKDGQKDEM